LYLLSNINNAGKFSLLIYSAFTNNIIIHIWYPSGNFLNGKDISKIEQRVMEDKMANRIKKEVAVGFIFIFAIGILTYYTVLMRKNILDPDKTYTINVVFSNISGLEVTNKVKINGVYSGQVDNIKLVNNLVHVRLRLFNTFTLYENYKIAVRSEAALGGRHVNVYPGIPVDSKGNEYDKMSSMNNLTGVVEDPLSAITDIINENKDNIYASIENIKNITAKINTGQGTLGRLLNDKKIPDQANSILKKTDVLLKDLNEAVEDAREQAPITSFIRAALMAF